MSRAECRGTSARAAAHVVGDRRGRERPARPCPRRSPALKPARSARRCRRRPVAPAARMAARAGGRRRGAGCRQPHGTRVEIHARRHVLHLRVATSYTTMKLWSVRVLDERDLRAVGRPLRVALRSPRCDERLLAAIHLGSGPYRRDLGAIDLPILRRTGWRCRPARARDRRLRRLAMRRRALVRAAHTACSGPRGSAVGFAPSHRDSGPSAHEHDRAPSSEMRIPDIMTPSSFMKFVSRTGVNSGAAAV